MSRLLRTPFGTQHSQPGLPLALETAPGSLPAEPAPNNLTVLPRWRGRDFVLLLVVLLLGMALRGFFWLDQGQPGVIFSGDADEYYRGAVHLFVDGSYYDEGQWLRPPLTSLFWAACFALFGPSIPAMLLAQCALGALTPLLSADSARRLFASRRAGLVAALLVALYLPYATIASQALSETVFIFALALCTWLLVLLQQHALRSPWLALLAGAAFAMSALARPVGLYALPFLLLWAWWQTRGARLWARLLPALCLLLGFGLVLAPWTLRNYRVYQQLVLVDTNGGVSFWFGTLKNPAEQKMQDVWKATLPNSALRQQAALQLGLANIRSDPWRWVSRMRNKVVSLWQLETRLFAGNAATGVTIEEGSLAYALLADGQYLSVVLLALAGIVLALRSERHWALIAWPLYGSLLSALTLGHPRLRLPLLLPLLLYAALPLAHPLLLTRRLRALRWPRRLLLPALALGFMAMLYASAYRPFAAGQVWALRARLTGNQQALQRASAADPAGFLPWVERGDAALIWGQAEQALAAYQHAAALAPRNVYSQARQIPLLLARGDKAAAARAMQAIADVDWDNNLLYAWAWDALDAPLPQRLDMDGAGDLGLITGFYRSTQEGPTTLRWAMSRASLRLLADGDRRLLRIRLKAEQPDTPVAVAASTAFGDVPLATLRIGTAWQTVELRIPDAAKLATRITITIEAAAPLRSWQQPYPRSVALDWAELLPAASAAHLIDADCVWKQRSHLPQQGLTCAS